METALQILSDRNSNMTPAMCTLEKAARKSPVIATNDRTIRASVDVGCREMYL